ncbi:NADH-dependent flavin oxidoreductase [Staphylococcus arlettae]|uniref:NADH-dependent flavin oxidoreductase n=1 Tax=Staphylococcus arlettae TaxID=29378 RepID=UPI002DBB6B4F|nr:NADH-dependent flavin oxidoreductase [Staphylococcus arlettae]MEB7421934.1 NADH-dependent flavin oxidoreductase [Staphylococcus arlettae]
MNEKFATLFETVELPNKVQLKNKFVLAPLTHVTSHDDGTVSEDEINYMEQRSQDVGLSLSAASNVTDLGKAFPGQPSVAHDTDIEGLKKLANVMKKNGAKAVVQIHHGGAQSLPNWTPNGDVAAPSPISMKSFGETEEHHAREITHDEILETIKAFGEATRRVIEAGFDGVEIHGANHYLIHQFVSPYYNRRTDEWGTDKFKFAREVVDEVVNVKKQYADDSFIIGYRFSPEEAESPGISMEITESLVKTLVEKPLDYLHVSLMDVHSKTREGKYAEETRIELLHRWIDGRMPLIGIGSIFTAEQALEAINTKQIELLALGRGILLDYQFVSKIEEGKEDEIISYFDPNREDKHHLPPKLWEQFNQGFYPLPRKDGK